MARAEIIEVPGPNGWIVALSFEDLQVEFRWGELSSDGRSMGHWGRILDAATGEELYFNRSDERWREIAIQKAAATLRIAQLRQELKLDQSLPFRIDREFRKSLIIELFERSQRGEYLGQLTGQQIFYVQEVAEIFDTEMRTILDLIDELSAEGRIGLNGMILIPHEDQEDTFAHWEKSTGHRRITVGDFGNWGCSACGRWGDEYDDPKDFPCEPESAVEKLVAAGGAVLDMAKSEQGELDPQKITPSEPSAEQIDPKYPAIALPSAEPEIIEGTPMDGCECICHRIAGISHIRACCGGSCAVVAAEEQIEVESGENRD